MKGDAQLQVGQVGSSSSEHEDWVGPALSTSSTVVSMSPTPGRDDAGQKGAEFPKLSPDLAPRGPSHPFLPGTT